MLPILLIGLLLAFLFFKQTKEQANTKNDITTSPVTESTRVVAPSENSCDDASGWCKEELHKFGKDDSNKYWHDFTVSYPNGWKLANQGGDYALTAYISNEDLSSNIEIKQGSSGGGDCSYNNPGQSMQVINYDSYDEITLTSGEVWRLSTRNNFDKYEVCELKDDGKYKLMTKIGYVSFNNNASTYTQVKEILRRIEVK